MIILHIANTERIFLSSFANGNLPICYDKDDKKEFNWISLLTLHTFNI